MPTQPRWAKTSCCYVWALMVAGCGLTQNQSTTVAGTVVDASTGHPIAAAVVALQSGTTAANAAATSAGTAVNFVFAAATDTNGTFRIGAPQNDYTLYAYAAGYRRSSPTPAGSAVRLALVALDASSNPPVLSSPTFVPSVEVPNDPVTFSVNVAIEDPNDPLLPPVLLANPAADQVVVLVANQGRTATNSTWTQTFPAPTQTGDFTWIAVAATSSGATSLAFSELLVAR